MSISLHRRRVLLDRLVLPGVLALILLGLTVSQGCVRQGTPSTSLVGRSAPNFTLNDLAGNQVTLSDFRGKVVFLNFWATWCPSCRAEMPEIEAAYQNYQGQNVVFIGVDLYENGDRVRNFVQEGGYSWTFVIDATGEVTKNYAVTGIPASFFLDKKGVVRAIKVGAMNREEIESQLARLLK